jgi:hypothetical protein
VAHFICHKGSFYGRGREDKNTAGKGGEIIGKENATKNREVDSIIKNVKDWRGNKMSQARDIILEAVPDIVEEVKWKKPSNPEGVPVWYHNGIICMGNILKSAVRLTFPMGALINDPEGTFNTRLDSKTVRAVDYLKDSNIDQNALKELVIEAAKLNFLKTKSGKKK